MRELLRTQAGAGRRGRPGCQPRPRWRAFARWGWRWAAALAAVVMLPVAVAGRASPVQASAVVVLPAGQAAAQASGLTYLSQFGAQGTGPGQFESPAAVAVNTNTGDVYVTDTTNDVVEEFDASGNFLSEFGGPGNGNGQFSQPDGIAVDPGSGDVYVLDDNTGIGFSVARIQKFDGSGNFLTSWTVGSFFTNQIAVDAATGDVYATDSDGNQVIQFDPSGAQIAAFGSQGPGPGQFETPTTITVDPSDGDLYVADTNQAEGTVSCRVQKFDSSFNFLFQFGGCGSGDGQFSCCGGIGDNSDEIVGPTGMAVDPTTGDLYAVDAGNNRVEVLDSSGNFLSTAGWGVADGASQFETCTSSCQAGSSGTGNGQFSNPFGDVLNPNTGQLYVVDNGNDRVEVLSTATVSISSSANPSVFGQPVTFTATVTAGAGQATGTVQFSVDNQALGAPVTLADGTAASPPASTLAVGDHTVTATYTPANGSGTITATLAPDQAVQQGAATTALTSAPNPSQPGQAVTYTATVAPVAPAAGTPTGTVSFADDGTAIGACTAQALAGTTATCTVTYPSPSTQPVTATYGGDTNFAASAPSNVVDQVVGTGAPAPVVTSITPTSGPGTGGTRVRIQGTNLCQATGVNFGTAAAAFALLKNGTTSGCTVAAVAPPGTGVVDVTVTSPGGTSATTPQDQFTYQ